MAQTMKSKFIPFEITIVDIAEMFNAAMLVITGYNIGNSSAWFAISTGALYSIGKKFVEIAKAKPATLHDPNPAGVLDVLPADAENHRQA